MDLRVMEIHINQLKLHEVICGVCSCKHCYNSKCFSKRKVTNEFSYKDILCKKVDFCKKTSNILTYKPLLLNWEDVKYWLNQTTIGALHASDFSGILEILNFSLLNKEKKIMQTDFRKVLDNLIDNVKIQNLLSQIGNLTTDTKKVDTRVRNSLSVKLGAKPVQSLSKILLPYIRKSYEKTVYNKYIKNIKIEPSHCDLVLYQTGGKFEIHRDKILKCPYKDNGSNDWEMCTIILCLDSNLDNRIRSNEGNTVVYGLPCTTSSVKDLLEQYMNSIDHEEGFKIVPHVFNQTVIPGNFLCFNSFSRHRSVEITSKDKYKFILKMDFWVNIKPSIKYQRHHEIDRIKNPTSSNFNCNCKLCDPFLYPELVQWSKFFIEDRNLNTDSTNLIFQFAFGKSLCYQHLNTDLEKYYPLEENYDYYYDDSPHCND